MFFCVYYDSIYRHARRYRLPKVRMNRGALRQKDSGRSQVLKVSIFGMKDLFGNFVVF